MYGELVLPSLRLFPPGKLSWRAAPSSCGSSPTLRGSPGHTGEVRVFAPHLGTAVSSTGTGSYWDTEAGAMLLCSGLHLGRCCAAVGYISCAKPWSSSAPAVLLPSSAAVPGAISRPLTRCCPTEGPHCWQRGKGQTGNAPLGCF